MQILNTKESLNKQLLVNRHEPTNSIIDTSSNVSERSNNFLKIMKEFDDHKLPRFLISIIPIDFHVEKHLEEVRKKYYPDYPSRLSCTFLSEIFNFSTPKHIATPLSDSKIIKCDMGIINTLRAHPHNLSNEVLLKGYWEGKTLQKSLNAENNYPPTWEYLVEGKVQLNYINY